MRYLLLVLLLFSTIPVHAQGDADPLYIQCGAEEYMIARYYILAIDNETYSPAFQDTEGDLADLGAHMLDEMQIRDALLEMEDIPECVAHLHKLTIRRSLITLDYEAFWFAASAIFIANKDFAFYAGATYEQLNTINGEINDENVRLGWVDENYDYVNEPPTLTPVPTEEE